MWLDDVAANQFAAIPADLAWDDAVPLAHLLDGYRLLELLADEAPDVFLERQREAQRTTGEWPGDAALLWTTLFLEARADHFGAHEFSTAVPHLDLLCRQLRQALIELEAAHA